MKNDYLTFQLKNTIIFFVTYFLSFMINYFLGFTRWDITIYVIIFGILEVLCMLAFKDVIILVITFVINIYFAIVVTLGYVWLRDSFKGSLSSFFLSTLKSLKIGFLIPIWYSILSIISLIITHMLIKRKHL